MNLVIGGMPKAGKSTLFKSFQKSRDAVVKSRNDSLFSTDIVWENPISKECAKVFLCFTSTCRLRLQMPTSMFCWIHRIVFFSFVYLV